MEELLTVQAPEPTPDPPDYIIETSTEPEGIRTCVRYMLPHQRYRLNLIAGLLLIVIGPTLIFLQETMLGIVGLVVGIYSLFFYATFLGRVATKQVAKLVEAYGTDTVPCQLVFWPQGVVVNNRISCGSVKIRYEIIRSIVRSGDFLTFRTAESQSVIIRLHDVAEEAAFIEYLKNKCTNAKCTGI